MRLQPVVNSRVTHLPKRGNPRLVLAFVSIGLVALPTGCGAHRRHAPTAVVEPGRSAFESYCTACHQDNGQGVADTPPLAGSQWITGPEDRLIRIVLHGVRGRMEVAGKTYDREMPGFGPVLSDSDVASLVTFVRSRFGALSKPVTPDAVREIREANRNRTDYWKTEELLNLP